jgi:peptidoglycan/LPS O-acetylase OafA/YrhL
MNVSVSIFATLIIVSLHISPKQRLTDLLSFKQVFIGKLSYGIYLVHVLVIHIVFVALEKLSVPLPLPWSLGFPIVLTVSVAVAYLLRITIERPMIAYGRSLAKRRPLVKPPEVDSDDGARAPSKTRLSA